MGDKELLFDLLRERVLSCALHARCYRGRTHPFIAQARLLKQVQRNANAHDAKQHNGGGLEKRGGGRAQGAQN